MRPHVLLEQFVTPRIANSMYAATRRLSARRVVCGDAKISWTERAIEASYPEAEFFRSQYCLQKIVPFLSVTLPTFGEVKCWTSEYGSGEYIDPHVDCAGDVQMVLCVRAPSIGNGGALCVRYFDEGKQYDLTVGDALLFRATDVKHWTIPLVPTADDPTPERVVICARYFLA
jgi:hypothetical protein